MQTAALPRTLLELLVAGVFFVAVSALIFWPLEEIFEHDKSPRPKLKDLTYMWFYQSYGLWIAAGIVFEIAFLLRHLMPHAWLYGVQSQPFWLQAIEALLMAETWVYVSHRLSHKWEFLWKFHQVHHTVEEMSWSASSRQHPVDFLLIIVGANLPAMILGIDLRSIAAFILFERFYTVLLHSNLRLDWGWFSKIVASPSLHKTHHQPDGHRTNYAGILSLLDTLANTYKSPTQLQETAAGKPTLP